jgi:hypothetical protein
MQYGEYSEVVAVRLSRIPFSVGWAQTICRPSRAISPAI